MNATAKRAGIQNSPGPRLIVAANATYNGMPHFSLKNNDSVRQQNASAELSTDSAREHNLEYLNQVISPVNSANG